MKKKALAILAAVIMVLSANFAFADDIEIELENDNRATATGGDASATGGDASANVGDISNNNANNLNNQNNINNRNDNLNMNRNDSRANSSSMLINNEAPNHIVAPLLSAFVGAPTSEVPKGWKGVVCDPDYSQFTYGELKTMADSGRLMDGRGSIWNAMTSQKVKGSVRSRINNRIDDNTIIKVINVAPNASVRRLGVYQGVGDWNWPVDEVLAKTVLQAVEETGSTNVAIYWDSVVDRHNSGSSLGIGFTGSGVDGKGAGSGSLGAVTGNAFSLTEVAYQVKVVAYANVGYQPDVCTPPPPPAPKPEPKVVPPPAAPAPQVKACDPSSIFTRIEELKQRIKECTRWCLNNLQLRSKLAEAYVDLYQCTGDKRYLNSAIEQFKIAERNYFRGHDIRANQAEADRLIAQDYFLWAGCIDVLYGPDAADRFAKEKRVEKVPQL